MALPSALTRRPVVLSLCAALVAALFGVAALAPLPFSVAYPGATVDVLGEADGEPVISVAGAEQRDPGGELRMTTIMATEPHTTIRLSDVVSGYFAGDRAVMPHDAVYPVGESPKEIREYNAAQMTGSQDSAIAAALGYLGLAEDEVDIELRLRDVGGPSAGLLFSLGIIDLLAGDDEGGDLTAGEVIAGTGSITADGEVGSVGGVPLKTQAAHRDGATVFLVPAAECAGARKNLPDGLRLLPVDTLEEAVNGLRALAEGATPPSC